MKPSKRIITAGWTQDQWNTFDVRSPQVPTFSCPNCRKAGVRLTLHDDWDGDDYRSWRLFDWRCPRCDCSWGMRSGVLAPDWSDRVN